MAKHKHKRRKKNKQADGLGHLFQKSHLQHIAPTLQDAWDDYVAETEAGEYAAFHNCDGCGRVMDDATEPAAYCGRKACQRKQLKSRAKAARRKGGDVYQGGFNYADKVGVCLESWCKNEGNRCVRGSCVICCKKLHAMDKHDIPEPIVFSPVEPLLIGEFQVENEAA